jgi:hypothetical protein
MAVSAVWRRIGAFPRTWRSVACLATLGIVVSGCGTAATTGGIGGAPTRQPVVVLHTNDNWGETLPCG